MDIIIGLIVLAIVALFAPQFITTKDPSRQGTVRLLRHGLRVIGVLFLLLAVASTSFVFVDADETGHRVKIYFGGDLKDGAIIAAQGEKGPQAEILPPGFQFEPFLNILYDVTMKQVVVIPEGRYGLLLAQDGRPLRRIRPTPTRSLPRTPPK